MQNRGSFDRFTERARKVLTLAQEEAQRFNHNYIGPEHILLGLIREGEGVAARVLSNMGVEPTQVGGRIEAIVGRGERAPHGDVGLTPSAKKVIELAVDEARRLGHHYIGTEHMLLGLMRQGENVAATVLGDLGVSLEAVRAEVIKVLTQVGSSPARPHRRSESRAPRPVPPARPEPAQWEYLTVRVSLQERGLLVEVAWQEEWRGYGQTSLPWILRLLGRRGWELAAVDAASVPPARLYIFRRPALRATEQPPLPGARDADDPSIQYPFGATSRQLLALAQQEARRLGHAYLGTDHLLLGLLALRGSMGLRTLVRLEVEPDTVAAEIEAGIGRGSGTGTSPLTPTPSALAVLEAAANEARRDEGVEIGDEHVLLGLLSESDSRPARSLNARGVTIERVRETIDALRRETPMEGSGEAEDQGPLPAGTAGFERFTERVRKVLVLAQEEAQRFNHNYIGTEHLLLGLVHEGEGIAGRVLDNLGIELTKVRSAVEFIIGRGERQVMGDIGLTPRAKKVIDLAVDEARRLGHHYIGTEHLLLGLIREGEGIAAGVLESLGVNLEKVRSEVIKVLTQTGPSPAQPGSAPPRPYSRRPANPITDTWEYLAVPVQERETEPDTRALVCGPPLQSEMLTDDITGMHVQHALRLLGRSGWELAAIDPAYASEGGRESLYIFKRQQHSS